MPDYRRAQHEAERIWKELGMSFPPLPILEVAEKFGLTVLEADFSGRIGLSGVLDVENKTIYLNVEDPANRKRFTLAHELGHWLLHPAVRQEKDSKYTLYYRGPVGVSKDDFEKEADAFAANLLVPLPVLKRLAEKYTRGDLADLFAVSNEVIDYRLRFLEGAPK